MEMLEKSIMKRPKTFEDCIAMARILFQENFYNQIAQLLYNFPPDQVREKNLTLYYVFFI